MLGDVDLGNVPNGQESHAFSRGFQVTSSCHVQVRRMAGDGCELGCHWGPLLCQRWDVHKHTHTKSHSQSHFATSRKRVIWTYLNYVVEMHCNQPLVSVESTPNPFSWCFVSTCRSAFISWVLPNLGAIFAMYLCTVPCRMSSNPVGSSSTATAYLNVN